MIGEYVFDAQGGRHQAFYTPIRDLHIQGQLVRAGERVQVEQSLKYSPAEAASLWADAGLTEVGKWSRDAEYGEC